MDKRNESNAVKPLAVVISVEGGNESLSKTSKDGSIRRDNKKDPFLSLA